MRSIRFSDADTGIGSKSGKTFSSDIDERHSEFKTGWCKRMSIQKNKWHEVWESRTENEKTLRSENPKEIFMELKQINGWDSSLRFKSNAISSVFEVGFGCGANLYLFQNDGCDAGGMDYAAHLIELAGRVLTNPTELICEEAANLSWNIRYEVVLSNSVFSYFDSYEYTNKVLEAMYNKANQSIGIMDIHNIDKKEEFIQFRRGLYQDLPKFFYEKSFFPDFAEKHNTTP